jgi:hypothetical protein
MCQTLGFHRESFLCNDPPALAEAKRHAFWMLYSMDKNLSLSLGRTSHFKDDDIDCRIFDISDNPQQAPWDRGNREYVSFARLQGRVYERLYSAKAMRQSAEERTKAVDELAAALLDLREATRQVYFQSQWFEYMLTDFC